MGWVTSRGSKMTDSSNPNWERELIAKLANDALIEQRRRRRWGIFFKLLTFAYVTFLRINSPGGSPVQAQTIYDEMRRLRKKYPDIPLYAVVEDICASGGYFVAVGADRIYVGKASIVGSVGVLMNGFGFIGLMDKLGIERRLITAGENKGMLDPFSPEREQDKEYIQAMMKDIHEQFISVVREGRGKRLKETPDMFSGLIWTGEKSVELGLADGYGSLEPVGRDVIKAEDIVDYTVKEGFAEKVAKRFGASVASSLAEFAVRSL